MKVLVAEAAWQDMLAIGRAIACDSPRRAETFIEELYRACEEIGHMPLAHPLAENHEAAGVRRKLYGSYLIFYRIAGGQVEVLHVLHGARDYERIVFGGEE